MIKRVVWELAVNTLGRSKFVPHKFRYFLYKISGMNVLSTKISSDVTFRGTKIKIAKGAFINQGCFINASEQVDIGENTAIAFNVFICTSTHEIGTEYKRAGKAKKLPVNIGSGCWIGANSTILPGVTIRDGCIIAAGSVVTKDCKPNGLYAGVPARRIKDLD